MPLLIDLIAASSIKAEAFNSFLPADLRVTGDGVEPDRQRRFVDTAFERVAALGARVVVFGSGGARNVPDGFDRDVAFRQIREFLARIADSAAQHGITVAIEPLPTYSCNIINSVPEALDIARQVNHPAIQVLSDFFHVTYQSQSFDDTASAGVSLRHVHIASPQGRNPVEADLPILTEFFSALRRGGYDSRISLECGWGNLAEEAAKTLSVLRSAWSASAAQ
jgi:sugar phosphate isomerase/epimerase